MNADLIKRVTDYLSGGGLFNPELADHEAVRDLLIACRDALAAQPAQGGEPVAWRITDGEGSYNYYDEPPTHLNLQWAARWGREHEPLYAAPQPQRRLTDEEIAEVCYQAMSYDPHVIARAVEAKLMGDDRA